MIQSAVDDAAVSHHRVEDLGVFHVAGGQFVAHLGVDGTVFPEQLVAHGGIQGLHVEVEVALHAVQAEADVLVLVALYLQAGVADHALHNIPHQVMIAVGHAPCLNFLGDDY